MRQQFPIMHEDCRKPHLLSDLTGNTFLLEYSFFCCALEIILCQMSSTNAFSGRPQA